MSSNDNGFWHKRSQVEEMAKQVTLKYATSCKALDPKNLGLAAGRLTAQGRMLDKGYRLLDKADQARAAGMTAQAEELLTKAEKRIEAAALMK